MTAASRARLRAAPLRFDLDGGATVFLEPDHAVPLVSIVVALRCGSAVDPAAKGGLARIALRMLRRGCDGMTAEQIDFRIDSLGGEMAVDTSPSTVSVHVQVIARSLDEFVELLARLLATSTFPEDELGRLKRETIAEIIEARDNDRVLAQKALQRTLFEGHPYAHNSGGTTESVGAIQRDDVTAYCRRFLVKGNVVVGIAGDVTPERAPVIAGRLLAGLQGGGGAPDEVAEPIMRAGRRLLIVDKPERTQVQLLVGTRGTSAHDADHVDLVVANAVFGGTFTSRLMKEVRSKRGWSYGASSRTMVDRRRQAWVMWTFPSAEDAAACLKLTIEMLEAWVDGGVLAREVAFIKRYLVRSYAFEVDTAAKRLHQALDVELLALPKDYYSGWIEHVTAVSPEGASAATKNRIHTENLLVVAVGTASQVLEPLRGAVPNLAEASVVPFDTE
ncbi:MAG TPA: pitrilysin family protein [Polyangiaceae bacterium]|nr:pitrilysin family protein [Polyangiaceae bacterium]